VRDALVSKRSNAELERLYRAEGERLWRALLGYTGDRDVASDALAEAFAQALRRGEAVRDPRRWVWRAAFRIAAGELKERARPGTISEAPVTSDSAFPMLDVVVALRKLSPSQRAAMVLHHYADYPVREVAVILNSTSAAVRVHLMRGRRRLRELLEDDDA
jgi:RNA polymerase sigma-70 factor, ECF subfamily